MHRQAYHEVAMVFVEVKFGRRRAVGLYGVNDLGNPGGTAFGEFQLLEEFADAPIPVASRHGLANPKLLQAHGTVRSGVTQNHQLVMHNADFQNQPELDLSAIGRILLLDGIYAFDADGLLSLRASTRTILASASILSSLRIP